MSRTVTAAARTAAEATHVRPVNLVALSLTPAVYVNSSDRDIVYNTNTYLGVGTLGAITGIQETASLQASGIKLAMTGIPSSYVSMALDQQYQGQDVTIYLGLLDDNYALIADPIVQWTGLIDQMSIILGETATIALTAENRLIRWEMPNVRRYTDADQQALYPDDLGLQYVAQTVEKEILWGRTRAR